MRSRAAEQGWGGTQAPSGVPGALGSGREGRRLFFTDTRFRFCRAEAGLAGSPAFEAAQQKSDSSRMVVRFNLLK